MKPSQGLAATGSSAALALALILLARQPLAAAPKTDAAARYLFPDWSDSLLEENFAAPPDLRLSHQRELKGEALAEFSKGQLAEDNGDVDEALQAYQRVLSLDPSYTDLAIKVALELARREQAPQGISILKDAVKAAPKNAMVRVCLGQLYAKFLKKPELALRCAEEAVQAAPDNFAGYAEMFQIHADAGHLKKAREVLQRAARVGDAGAEFHLHLAEVLLRLAVPDEKSIDEDARRELDKTLEKAAAEGADAPAVLAKAADLYVVSQQVKEAVPLYRRSLDLGEDDNSADTRDKLAASLRVLGEKKEAVAVLEQLLKDNPGRIKSREQLGELYEEQGDLDRALDCYEAALQADASQPASHLRVADLCLKTKHPERAVQILTTAREKFPDAPQVTYSLAVALREAKDYPKALALFESARKEAHDASPDLLNAAFFYAYGTTAQLAGDFAQAVEMLKKSVTLDPQNAEFAFACGAAAERAGDIDYAATMLKKSIELDPQDSAEACNYIGYMWTDRAVNLDEAGKYIRRALDAQPDNPAFLDSLGWWLFRRGENKQALEQLQHAAAHIEPPDPEVFRHLGDTFDKLGDPAQALANWKKAAALDPADQKLAEKIKAAQQQPPAPK